MLSPTRNQIKLENKKKITKIDKKIEISLKCDRVLETGNNAIYEFAIRYS